ncbi:Na+/H+ antiporter [Solwaraspora sp. WMMD1047]|uniref:Na+/H+ antiporter n=1 Tax=Solwaraspora sp. WMMD1047 TaxID=3016102 RepID=UPI0024167D5D|nr:Na+/H+ antiporter [Solwaraspora sp. WMMD1047]MDG4831399.1 Na+/H+ antiporter [Solwaraspora sp. WMMD1047]
MEALVEAVLFLTVAILGTALARRFGLLSPILLVFAGLGLSLVPGFPDIRLHPEVVLAGILPPLLYVAAVETSVPAFRRNLRPILLLAVGLVLFTAVLVGVVVHLLLPELPLAICLAFGAVVAPPDAIAATAVARRVGLPRRVVTILEGESLVNDATALVLLRVATAAALGAAVQVGEVVVEVVVAAGGGILVGAAGALVIGLAHRRTSDPVLDNALSLLTPFLVALVAELIGASSVVAVVVAGLALGHRLPVLMSAASRLQMTAFWNLVKFLLEGVVFLLVGLQLRDVVQALEPPWTRVALVTGVVLLTVLVGRFVWVFPAAYLVRLAPRFAGGEPRPPVGLPVVVSWAGMRGVVTLAAALSLPLTLAGGATYPRELFIWTALAVIMVTLVVQGTTLPAVARRSNLPPDDPAADVLAGAAVQQEATRAAEQRLAAAGDELPPAVRERLRQSVRNRALGAWELLGGDEETPSQAYARLRREMIEAEREVFRRARDDGRIAEEVLVRAYRDLDLEESLLRHGSAE